MLSFDIVDINAELDSGYKYRIPEELEVERGAGRLLSVFILPGDAASMFEQMSVVS